MIFSEKRSLESICGVEISDDDNDAKKDDDEYFKVEVKSKAKTPAKKKKKGRFEIGTPAKVLEEAKKEKHSVQIKKKSPKLISDKKMKSIKSKNNFFEMIYPCTKCKRKFVTQDNLEKHMLKHTK